MALQYQMQTWCLVFFFIQLMGSGVEGLSASNALTHYSFTFPKTSDLQKGQWDFPPVRMLTKEMVPWDYSNSDITLKHRHRRQAETRANAFNDFPVPSTKPKARKNFPQKSVLSSDFKRRLRNFRRLLPILRAFDRRRQMLSERLIKKPKLATKRDRVKQKGKGNGIPKSNGSKRTAANNAERRIVSRVLRIQK